MRLSLNAVVRSGEAGSSTRVKGQLFDLEKVVEAAVRMMDDNYLDWFY